MTSPLKQTAVTVYNSNNVVIRQRFSADKARTYRSVSKASMNRLLSLPSLTSDWPVTVEFDFGTIWIDWVLENSTRDAWRQIHAGMSNDEWAGYHGPSAMTDEERDYHKVVEYEDGGTE